ncbi:hypothetical protein ACHAXM_002380 [Skeletonema potamos]|jgi:hypothetical protein
MTMMATNKSGNSAKLVILLLLISLVVPLFSFQPPQSSSGSSRTERISVCCVSPNDDTTAAAAAVCTDKQVSRRHLFGQTLTSFLATNLILGSSQLALAKVVATPSSSTIDSSSAASSIPQERNTLLEAISSNSSDEVIVQAIQNLIPLNPLKSSSPSEYNSALDGEWKLLWYNKSDFSPLLKLPSPFRPDSYQYFGKIAEQEVGEGRVAQGLVGGVVSLSGGSKKELWLSSGAVPSKDDPSILEIYPPFRFQLGETPGSSSPKSTIVESQSDAEFRAANARSTEAQLAPKNEYEQVYLENFGSGSLRVSVITKGDPVIVGDMFVHQKM